MATLIKIDGSTETVKPSSGKRFNLHELQTFVGGYFQMLAIGSTVFVMDEEGKLKGKELNKAATHRAHDFLFPGDYLVGDVLICEIEEIQGEEE